MPHIIFDGPKLDKSQKRELVKAFTEIASRVTKMRAEAFTVTIKENAPENVGVGGQLLSERS